MTNKELVELVDAISGKKVLVVGDVMLDEFVWGDTRRISPEAPVLVVEMRRRTHVPGGAGNTAANVVSLGGRAVLAGVVGADHHADWLREALTRSGVSCTGLLVDESRPTTTKSRVLAHNQQVVRVDYEERKALEATVEERLLNTIEAQLREVDACVLSDYDKGVVSSRVAESVIRMARESGKPVVVDPKGFNYAKYRGATVVKPNIPETERFLKTEIRDDVDLAGAGARLSAILENSAILITRGPQGMSLFRHGETPVHIPSAARDVFDVTGAGDTVISCIVLALSSGATLIQAAHLANLAAGIVVGKVGTATVTPEEVLGSLVPASEKKARS